MQSSRRPKTLIEAERHTLEFTSGQLIIAICGLLFLWLVGFLMGVMAGRVEFGASVADLASPAKAIEAPNAAPKTPDRDPAPKATKDQPKPTANRTASVAPAPSKPVSTPPQASAAPAAPPKPAEETRKPVEPKPDAPRLVTDRPSRAATQTRDEAVAAPTAPAGAEPPNETPKAETTAVAKADTEAPKPAASETPVQELAKEELPAPTKTGRAPSGKYYTVQVFSVKSANKANAEEYITLLKQNSGLEGKLIQSGDKKLYQVIIGEFPSRKEAENLRDELKKRAGFADCIVREVAP